MGLKVGKPYSVKGVIFIPTLFSILVITSLIILLLQRGTTVSVVENAIREQQQLDGKARSYLAEQAFGSARCPQGSNASLMGNLTVCRETHPTLSSYPAIALPTGIPDLSSIMESLRPCPKTPEAASRARFYAPASAQTCSFDEVTVTSSLIVEENLTATTLTVSSQALAVVASLGSILVDSLVVKGGDVLLVATGEIHVSSLSNQKELLSKITMLASRGQIKVETASPNISLLLVGRSELRAPETLFVPPFPLPSFRRPTLIGIIPTRRVS